MRIRFDYSQFQIRSKSRRQGFTLIEMLAVIAIIGILFAILIPVIGGVRSSMRSTKSIARLRSFTQCAFLYKADTGFLAPHRMGDEQNATRLWFFQYFVTHYLDKNPEAARSPFDDWDLQENEWAIPGSEQKVKISYGRNGDYPLRQTMQLALDKDAGNPSKLYYPPDEYKIIYPSETAYYMEASSSRVRAADASRTINFHHQDGSAVAVSYFDGHVEIVEKKNFLSIDGVEPTWSQKKILKFWTGDMIE